MDGSCSLMHYSPEIWYKKDHQRNNKKINAVIISSPPETHLEIIKTEITLSDLDIIQKKLEKGKKKLLQEKEIKILGM